nr:thyroid receptor-interacting protein 11-like isoform X1 [Microcebus murinus]XP_020137307.1 thyroid receptor-interacting protein 11-like isoform X1 [Microcebus murinus]
MKEQELDMKVLDEKNMSLTKTMEELCSAEIFQRKDWRHRVLALELLQLPTPTIALLQQQLQARALEKKLMLAVWNAKANENSYLKRENHQRTDITVAKEAAISKPQDENKKLSTSLRSSGHDETFRDTIQHSSHLIREKGLEIDALSQKCQTLVTILQTSSTGNDIRDIDSNRFEELLEEHEKSKHQLGNMAEWQQQVVSTVRNVQHEAAQLQEAQIQHSTGQLQQEGQSFRATRYSVIAVCGIISLATASPIS